MRGCEESSVSGGGGDNAARLVAPTPLDLKTLGLQSEVESDGRCHKLPAR